MLIKMLEELRQATAVADITKRFHNTLAEMIVATAKRCGEKNVVLTGGCFQNRLLTERAAARLKEEGLTPIVNRRVPPNDGGIALGQIMAAANIIAKNR